MGGVSESRCGPGTLTYAGDSKQSLAAVSTATDIVTA